ncbi:MAG: glycine oxidase ThiO [Gemmataceae bacterium]|nr:glycine oxidase ThiO [Gemmataceae bacterium]
MTAPDALILGGGVIGLTTAYYLARAGVRVQLLDQGDFGQEASWAGAGILPPGNPRCARTPFDRLRAHSVAMFPQLSDDLKELTGIDNGYLRSGGLEFVGPDAAHAVEEWGGEGIEVQHLTASDLHQREPLLAADLGAAVFLPEMAQVRNPWHLRALIEGCKRLGVQLRPGEAAQALVRDGPRVRAVRTAAGDIAAATFVVAAGAWSDQLLATIGCRLGVRPVRGQIVLLHPDKPMLRHILLWGARYLVPRGDGRVLAGSTEEDAGFDKRTTAIGVQGLLELAIELVPALAQVAVERSWAGLRPGSPDGLPYIGVVPGIDNLFVAAGHFRAGIQLSPGTALLLKELILKEPPGTAAGAFRLDRETGHR